jgi:ketosteroid isomerase-like protein
VQGKEAIRGAWAQLLAIPGLKIDWQITKVDVSRAGDMAYTLYRYEMTMPAPKGASIVAASINGAPINDKGKDMSVWKKQSDGKWKMVADTFNSDIPLQSDTSK